MDTYQQKSEDVSDNLFTTEPQELVQQTRIFHRNYFEILNRSKNIKDFSQKVEQEINKLGFSNYGFSYLELNGEIEVKLTNTPKELIDDYFKEKFQLIDPTTSYARANNIAVYHSDIEDELNALNHTTDITLRTRKMFNMLRFHGYSNYYLVPIKIHSGRGNAMLTVSSKNVDRNIFKHKMKQHEPSVQSLCQAIDYVGSIKYPEYLTNDINTNEFNDNNEVLHVKSIEILSLLANQDVTIQQAANKLFMSKSNADNYLLKARRVLNATSTRAAINIAIAKKIIVFTT